MPRCFLVDTDTASDDAVALIMALRAPDVRVIAVTTVAGNVDVERATRNALYTVELCDADVPVYRGAAKPLLRSHQNAAWFHGRDGLGDHGYAAPQRTAQGRHAVDAMIEAIESNPGLVLVTLGPLTNVALALARKPEIAKKVSRCVVMGGAPCCEGNVTPAAEYNIWVDPEAARIVLGSGLPKSSLDGTSAATRRRSVQPISSSFSASLLNERALPSNATATPARPTSNRRAKTVSLCRTRSPCRSLWIPPSQPLGASTM